MKAHEIAARAAKEYAYCGGIEQTLAILERCNEAAESTAQYWYLLADEAAEKAELTPLQAARVALLDAMWMQTI